MKRIGIFLFFLFPVLVFSYQKEAKGEASSKIALVDFSKALNVADAGMEAKAKIKQDMERVDKERISKEEELKRLDDELKTKSSVLSAKAKEDKEEEFKAKLRGYEKLSKDFQDDLREKEQEAVTRITKELQEIVTKIGNAEKYTIILEKSNSGVVFAVDGMDITDRVIKEYNESYKLKSKSSKSK